MSHARVVFNILASGGAQNFLNARWVAPLVTSCPAVLRRRLAMRVLLLSPHYTVGRDGVGEHARNRRCRAQIARDLLSSHLRPNMTVLDFGCGPGYLAHAVAAQVHHVYAVDISSGAIACARALNAASNITYHHGAELPVGANPVDLAYSVAVAQHLTDPELAQVFDTLHRCINPGGLLFMHVVVDTPGWRNEQAWRADRSLRGRLRWRYGLHCFSREYAGLRDMAVAAGFDDVVIASMAGRTRSDDDVAGQQLLTARRAQPIKVNAAGATVKVAM